MRFISGTQLRFRCGDTVIKMTDQADEATVIAAFDWTVRIKWDKRGYREDVNPDELLRIGRAS